MANPASPRPFPAEQARDGPPFGTRQGRDHGGDACPHASRGVSSFSSAGALSAPGCRRGYKPRPRRSGEARAKGVVCLISALAFHELTDAIPRSVWIAIGPTDRRPAVTQPPLQIVRFRGKMLHAGIEEHRIEGVTVRSIMSRRPWSICSVTGKAPEGATGEVRPQSRP